MYKKFLIILPLLLLGAGCLNNSSLDMSATTSMHHMQATSTATSSDMHHMMMTGGATLAGDRIALDTTSFPQSGPITFSFKLFTTDKSELTDTDLKIEHGKRMHFILVRDDMTQFQHIHPEYKDGKWTVTTTIPEIGQYQIYADIAPEKESAVVLRVPVTIGGATKQSQIPTPNVDMTATTNGIAAKITTDKVLATHQETTLTFTLIKNGQPVKELNPYLGAYGHVVLLRHGSPDDYIHVHPITETKPLNGQIQFAATFPEIGRYTLYAQFNVADKVETFPITVDVGQEGMVSHEEGERMSH
jgi:hypothetical protein